ncbi:pyrimidine dimer DNA glycosylase/endonuclease V [Nitrosomonas sp.]|uniref:pyrimidine dimer DNA glycosylase/endonuclease V n=1 Tax=Nitrosomonas sp. TaxID=42353 RepID=UPI00271F2338|nr:pyrimidine dimer DNA glycosylase/endonuclease V [Nitrosomonas sp.]MDO8893409.1 pyrimidine dimer DNA glycosylase/endonuclease V [Nitrosomonas sp.]MDP1788412.1 pyrimidine dimer DNA glycosylase/endonuclease V [Nitrosomonas sp.]MDP2223607.1 pyrimidine dimer DNA glycosylase/endonuclease V [Nitrosomonas sp.]
MRLWSVHPYYLDAKGLVALWREGLLAQKVLQGHTKGYKNHPQLTRFKNTKNPVAAIAAYLGFVVDEAEIRGYHSDRNKITARQCAKKFTVTSGQLEYEFGHLLGKLKDRDPRRYARLKEVSEISAHPIFNETAGNIEDWEIINPTK